MAELSKAIARLMEEREQAPPPPRYRTLLERLRELTSPAEHATARTFASLLLEKAPAAYFDRARDDILAGMCASAFRFAAAGGQEPRVRVFNPELERDGWEAPVTAVEAILSDRPFVADTVRNGLECAGGVIRHFLRPVFRSERDQQQKLLSLTPPDRAPNRECFLHVEIGRLEPPEARVALEADLQERLRDLLVLTNDYQAMRRAAQVVAETVRLPDACWPASPPAGEVAAFLEWLDQGHFVYLGYRAYRLEGTGAERAVVIEPGSGLGLLRKEQSTFAKRPRLHDLPPRLQERILAGPPLVITKTRGESPIRRAHMDSICVCTYGPGGEVSGSHRLLGLLTSEASTAEAAAVPLVRWKLEAILSAAEKAAGRRDREAVASRFDSMPKAHLLSLPAAEIQQQIRAISAAERAGDTQLTIHPDASGRGVFAMVTVPRDRFSADVRRRIGAALARSCGGQLLDEHAIVDDSPQVRLHAYLAAPAENIAALRPETLRHDLRELLRSWDDRLCDALALSPAGGRAGALVRRYAAAFPPQYKEATDERTAAQDVERLEAALTTREPQIALLNPNDSAFTSLRLYLLGEPISAGSLLLPIENLGLRVFDQRSIALAVPGGETVYLQTFDVLRPTGERLHLDRTAPLIAEAIIAHCRGRLPTDRLNTLVSDAGLSWRQVDVMRALAWHAAQSGAVTCDAGVAALVRHPTTARLLWEYFEAKFTPANPRSPRERLAAVLPPLAARFHAHLHALDAPRDERIFRVLFSTIAAAVRTNFFCGGDGALAIKLEAEKITPLPPPQPLFEVVVHSACVSGIYLRAAKVARGGIQLTEPAEDCRRQALELMRKQAAANACITPAGAGGVLWARTAGGETATASEGAAACRSYISSLLDLTDNVVEGRLVPAAGVLYDGPDSYLAIAAETSTAGVAEMANEIARARHFWLGDAFAAGRARGYGQRKTAAAARGDHMDTGVIDGAAGVMLSDYEVNVRIALHSPVESGELTGAGRDQLLAQVADELAGRVLRRCARQALGLRLEQLRSQSRPGEFVDLIHELESDGILARAAECLPDRNTLRHRRRTFRGLTRPELTVLVAHAKLGLREQILASSLPEDAYLDRELYNYFPAAIVERQRSAVTKHRLRRDIIAAALASQIIDLSGSTFARRVRRETGGSTAAVARAWVVALALADVKALYGHLLATSPPPAPALEARLASLLDEAIEAACAWLVNEAPAAATAAELVDCFLAPVCELLAELPAALPATSRARFDETVETLIRHGLGAEDAARCARLAHLRELLEVASIAAELEVPLYAAARTYYRVSELADFEWVQERLASCVPDNRWERRALAGLGKTLASTRRALTRKVLDPEAGGTEPEDRVRAYGQANALKIAALRDLLDDVKSAAHPPTLAVLVVVTQAIARLGEGD